MKELSGDPYAGAQRAYQVLNPHATGEDWENFVSSTKRRSNGEFDDYASFARLCESSMTLIDTMEPRDVSHIAYAGGYFEAMGRVMATLLDVMPISGRIPHHINRYRASLIDPDAQF